MAGSTTYSFRPMTTLTGGPIKDEMLEKFAAGEGLTQQEQSFISSSVEALRQKLGQESGSSIIDIYDRMFIDGTSVRDLCRRQTLPMNPTQMDNYMDAFLLTEMLKRDKPIDFLPPGKENSDEANPAIRVDTRLSEVNLEQERPKRGFWRTIGEALRIVKPLPTPQEIYEQKMEADTVAGTDTTRGSAIKQSVLAKASGAQPQTQYIKEQTNLKELEPAKERAKVQKITEPKVVELTPEERQRAETQLQNYQAGKELFEGTVYSEMHSRVSGLASEHDAPHDLTKLANDIQQGKEISTQQESGDLGEPKSYADTPALGMFNIVTARLWQNIPVDDAHPNGKAFKVSLNDCKDIVSTFDNTINDLNKKLNPPQLTGPGMGQRN